MTTNDTTSDHGKHKYFSLVLKWPSHQDEDDAPFGHASKKGHCSTKSSWSIIASGDDLVVWKDHQSLRHVSHQNQTHIRWCVRRRWRDIGLELLPVVIHEWKPENLLQSTNVNDRRQRELSFLTDTIHVTVPLSGASICSCSQAQKNGRTNGSDCWREYHSKRWTR